MMLSVIVSVELCLCFVCFEMFLSVCLELYMSTCLHRAQP